MAITIHRAVVHELIKEKNEEPQPLHYRQSLLPVDNESVQNVIAGVVNIYGRKNNSARYGVFRDDEASGSVPDSFYEYSELEDVSDEDFMALSKSVMQELFREATGVAFATGGHILFSDYESDGVRFYLAAMIKQKSGFAFSDTLGVEDLEYIDLSKLHQAIKINFSKYSAYQNADDIERQDSTYLSFVSPQTSQSAAGYFIQAMGCKAGAPSAKATQAAVDESVGFFESKEDLKAHAPNLKRALTVYLEQKAESNEPATLPDIEGIARRFFPTDDEEQADRYADEFVTYLNREESGVPPEFPVNKTKLKTMTHLVYKGDDLHLEFDKEDIGGNPSARVYFDGAKVIIKDLPQDLIDKLNQQING
ncbi:TPA: nucleoid-associated protein [Vibrio parahaemolyticus]|nr:hypothetical protein ACS86_02195 [Vibrio alginolyticus]